MMLVTQDNEYTMFLGKIVFFCCEGGNEFVGKVDEENRDCFTVSNLVYNIYLNRDSGILSDQDFDGRKQSKIFKKNVILCGEISPKQKEKYIRVFPENN